MLDSELSLRERSFRMNGNRVEAVLYTLLRDGDLVPGVLEKTIRDVEDSGKTEFQFSNGFLALYAKDIVSRLEKMK